MFPHSQCQVFYERPCATNRALYLMISLFSLRFRTNTHLFPTGFILAGAWTTGLKTSRLINECNSACIASLHLGQSFLCLHSFVFCGSGSLSFCMMSKATWKAKILFTSKLFRSHFHPCAHNLLRHHYFQVPVPLLGLFVHFVSLQGFGFQYLTLHGHFAFHLFSASGELCLLTQWASHASSVF